MVNEKDTNLTKVSTYKTESDTGSSSNYHSDAALTLLRYDAVDVNIPDINDFHPLVWAIINDLEEVFDALLLRDDLDRDDRFILIDLVFKLEILRHRGQKRLRSLEVA